MSKICDVKRSSLGLVVALVFFIQFGVAGCSGVKTVRVYDGEVLDSALVSKVKVPASIVVESIDGVESEFQLSNIAGLETEYVLLPGEHKFSVRFSVIWDVGGGEIDKIRSQRSVLVPIVVERGHTYQLGYDKLEYFEDAQKFALNPIFWLKEGVEVGKILKELPADSVQRRAQLSFSRVGSSLGGNQQNGSDELSSVDLMKFWWGKATKEERESFLKWQRSSSKGSSSK